MPEKLLHRMWQRVASWVTDHAQHVTVRFMPDADGEPIHPHAGYLRLWLAEGFLARQRVWGANQFPALHGGVSLDVSAGERATFTSFSRPPDAWTVPGAQLDFPITTLLPFAGGTVEVEAALYEARTDGPLGTAIELMSGLAALLGPPLATAAVVADRISTGLDSVLSSAGAQPVLALHAALVSPGGGGTAVRPGYLAVLASPESELAGTPVIHHGRLHLRNGRERVPPTGVDYLVVRVECRTERDDWRFPELDDLIRAAGVALIHGHRDTFRALRTDAIARAWNSADLTPADRKRVALLVRDELDGLGELGIVPGPQRSLDTLAAERLVTADDPRLDGLTLPQLIAV
ncbi:hypothetical protein [Pseudonocardia sp.]|uniref:hypothetical protein n=1 Tax=Pseudonocardia sp. TaxID=60912 RepID=UPI003D13DF33